MSEVSVKMTTSKYGTGSDTITSGNGTQTTGSGGHGSVELPFDSYSGGSSVVWHQ